MKLVLVMGVRPNFIKLSALHGPLSTLHQLVVVHTGQHYDSNMSEVFLGELELPLPDYNLAVGRGSPVRQTAEILFALENVLRGEKPDMVLVMGDATSSMAGALAAVKCGYAVGHIEAGSRNHDLGMQEEVNRLIIDSFSTIFFASTHNAIKELKRRGVESNVYFTGDVLLDTVMKYLPLARLRSSLLNHLALERKSYMLATIHRASNTDSREALEAIVNALVGLNRSIVFSVHPRTLEALKAFDLLSRLSCCSHILLMEPLPYLDMLLLLDSAQVVLSDSNGIQREAFFVNTPCLIPRSETEYPETIECGCAALLSPEQLPHLKDEIDRLLDLPKRYDLSLFGHGHAADTIAGILANHSSQVLSTG